MKYANISGLLVILATTMLMTNIAFAAECKDSDGDLWGDVVTNTTPCIDQGSCNCGDCDDIFPDGYTINPARPEECNDNFDNNCNGLTDCHDAACCGNNYCPTAPDDDGDGYTVCTGDCNDIFPDGYTINPNRPEDCNDNTDNNCNGLIDCLDSACCGDTNCQKGPPDWLFDSDHDGFISCQGDCNDTNPNINPNATEICDGIDNNCNSLIDEGIKNTCTDYTTCSNYTTCDQCPAAPPELCDGIDNNCNGAIDEGTTTTCTNYTTCTSYTACGQCPAAPPETCNGIDDDCNSLVDEIFYGLGQTCGTGACAGVSVCNPSGDGTICNGTAPSVEICTNLIDDDCDETTDCDDQDCRTNPACINTTCRESGKACTETEQCCNDLKCKKILYSRPCSRICCDKDECATSGGCVDENTCMQDHLRKVCGKGIWLPQTRIERNCKDEVDNDCDGKIDCTDNDCRYFPKCKSVLQCKTNSDCLSNEVCKKGTCTILICNGCRYANNHQCNGWDCCSKKDCNRGEVCLSHKCRKMPLKFELQKEYLKQSVENAIENAGQKIKDKKDGGYDQENLSNLEDKFMKAATAYNKGDYDNAESFAVEVISDGENSFMSNIYSIIRKIKLIFSGSQTT